MNMKTTMRKADDNGSENTTGMMEANGKHEEDRLANPLMLVLIDKDASCRAALRKGLESTGEVSVFFDGNCGDDVIDVCHKQCPDVVWLDVYEADNMSGIKVGMHLRQQYPELPIILYAMCGHIANSSKIHIPTLLTHYAFLSKTTYRLPEQFVETMREIQDGRSIVDPGVARWLQTVRQHNANSPMLMLSPGERDVVSRLELVMTNTEIACDLGLKDGRAVSRINGDIYAAWGVPTVGTYEKVARTRATLIYLKDILMTWDAFGKPVAIKPTSMQRRR